eukprot:EG_transcript_12866
MHRCVAAGLAWAAGQCAAVHVRSGLLSVGRRWKSQAGVKRRTAGRDAPEGQPKSRRGRPPQTTPRPLDLTHFIDVLSNDPRVEPMRFDNKPQPSDGAEALAVTSFLNSLKVDSRWVAQHCPAVLHADVAAMEATARFLRGRRVAVAEAVRATPYVLLRDAAYWRGAWDIVAGCGIDPARVVYRQPPMLLIGGAEWPLALPSHKKRHPPGESPYRTYFITREELAAKAAFFTSLQLDATHLLATSPRTYSVERGHAQQVFNYLERLGFDVIRALAYVPQILERRVETLEQKVKFLKDNDLDVAAHLQACPQILLYSVDRKLRPALDFVLTEMGRPRAEVNATPTLWRYSTAGWLRPRAEYLRAVRRDGYRLTSVLRATEQHFVTAMAKRSLTHYRRWLDQQGYTPQRGGVQNPA